MPGQGVNDLAGLAHLADHDRAQGILLAPRGIRRRRRAHWPARSSLPSGLVAGRSAGSLSPGTNSAGKLLERDPGQRGIEFAGEGIPALRGHRRPSQDPASERTRSPSRRKARRLHPAGVFDHDGTARPEVPEPDRPIQAPRADFTAIGPEGDRLDEVGMAVKRRQPPAGRDLPEPDAPVLARRDEVAAVGAEGEVQDESFVREDRQRLDARRGVTELDGVVPPAGGQPFPVGAVGEAVDPFLVAFEVVKLADGLEVPDLHDFRAGDGEPFPVGMERDLVHPASGTWERLDLLSRRHIPDLDPPDLVTAVVPVPHGERLAVGAEGHAHGVQPRFTSGPHVLSRLHVPDHDEAGRAPRGDFLAVRADCHVDTRFPWPRAGSSAVGRSSHPTRRRSAHFGCLPIGRVPEPETAQVPSGL